ncbi:hypothetical protein ETE48_10070 [Escherichia coli]|uniref:hypothetical protein n=1 Tax=Escherichia coli TaxID=562 RepID=UPI00100944F5|nr:hypothetical protein [Escherichia coli]QAU58619.1 hypothetical protein ETE48_10070 [Escherichia coli]
MQITEALISEPGDIRRFVQQAVDHWPHLLAFYFTLHSAEGNINGQQIHAFCTSFYRQVHERITERNHDLLQHSWQVISAGGQCRVERCFRVARGDTSGQYVALKTAALSLGLPVVTAITHRPVQRCTLITAQ